MEQFELQKPISQLFGALKGKFFWIVNLYHTGRSEQRNKPIIFQKQTFVTSSLYYSIGREVNEAIFLVRAVYIHFGLRLVVEVLPFVRLEGVPLQALVFHLYKRGHARCCWRTSRVHVEIIWDAKALFTTTQQFFAFWLNHGWPWFSVVWTLIYHELRHHMVKMCCWLTMWWRKSW